METSQALYLLLTCLLSLAMCQRSLSASSSTTDVRIRVSVSEHLVTLSCDVTASGAGSDDHKVQFYCPVLSSNLQCFGECSPICNMQSDGSCPVLDPILVSGVTCGKSVRPPDAKSVSLTVDTRLARLAGAWNCKFRGAVSAIVDLAVYFAKTTPKPRQPAQPLLPTVERDAVAADSPPTTAPAADLGVWKPDVRRFPAELPSTQDGFERHPNLAKFARTDYIIGVLAIMSASLLLNLGFCVRCILARHYVETRKRSRRKPLSWLGSCLCVSTVQVDDLDTAVADPRSGRVQRQRRQDGLGATDLGHNAGQNQGLLQQQQQQQQQHCMYCLQTDCRILYDDVARTGSECGSSCFRGYTGGGAGGSFRVPNVNGRGGSISMSGVPEETAAGRDAEVEVDVASSMDQQEDAESDVSASGGGAGTRLALSRRMLRKADTLLREANSLLLETEPATDEPPEQ